MADEYTGLLPAADLERWTPLVKSVKTDKHWQALSIMLKDKSSLRKDAHPGFNGVHHRWSFKHT